jgi:hypothetical protein
MKNVYQWAIFLLITMVILVGCSGNATATQSAGSNPPSAQPNSQSIAATNQPYPAGKPGAQGQPAAATPAGYPAAGQAAQPQAAQNPQSGYPAQGGALVITLPGGGSQPISPDTLKSLPASNVNIAGKDQSLRKLGDMLNMVGASNYTKVTATGKSGSLTITKDQAAQAYIDLQADGTVRLLVQGVDQAQWPAGVTAIQVQ